MQPPEKAGMHRIRRFSMPEPYSQEHKSQQGEKRDGCDGEERLSGDMNPDLERIRRKLLRLMILSTVITLLLVGAVLVAVVYKITRPAAPHLPPFSADASEKAPAPVALKLADREIMLAPGAQLISQSLSGSLISLETLMPDNSTELIIYDYREGRVAARLRIPAGDASVADPE